MVTESEQGWLSKWKWVLVGVGAALAVIILLLVVICCCKRRPRSSDLATRLHVDHDELLYLPESTILALQTEAGKCSLGIGAHYSSTSVALQIAFGSLVL